MLGNNAMKKQTGVALFVCLMILLILSLLGISALRMVTSQNLISSSSQGADIAFDGAETGINQAIIGAAAKTIALPTAPGITTAVNFPKDNRNIATIDVNISMPDPTANITLGKRTLAAMVEFGTVPGVTVENFRFESTSTIDALDIKTTHVQDTIYPHL